MPSKKQIAQAIAEGKITDEKSLAFFLLDSEIKKLKEDIKNITNGKDGKTPTEAELLSLIRPLIADLKPEKGKDGKTYTTKELLAIIKPLIKEPPTVDEIASKVILPAVERIEKNLPMASEAIRDSLELLIGDERLDASAIKGIPELKTEVKNITTGYGGLNLKVNNAKIGATKSIDFVGSGVSFSKVNGQETLTFAGDTDEKVKLNASDPTAGYLDDKITGYGFLTAETDPVYTASSWFTTTNNASNWDTAYGWGNHASAGYLTVIPSHASSHAVGGADSVFPADPNADRYLKWNDTSGAIEWATVSSVSFGTTTQIPYMNAGGTDFLYSANLKYNGTTFTTNSITVSGLTSGRIPYITTDGLLTDGATLTYSATTNKVTNTPIATATGGITVVGSTYPYTGTSAIVVGNFTRYTDKGSGTVGPNMEGLNVDVRSRRNIDIDDGSETELTAVGLDIYTSQTGNLSGDEGYFSNYVAGGTLDASITGTWSVAGSVTQQNYGFQFETYESVVINNASLDVVDTNYGVQGIATNNSTITSANSATSTNIGGYFALTSNGAWAGGAFQKIGYGLLIENNFADKFNTAWGIYISVNGGSNFLGGDNIKTKFGTGYDASVYYDGTNFIINPKSVGTGYLSILGTLYLGAQNIQTDTTTGMQIGTLGGASGQKLGFFAQTPIVQPVLATGAGATVDNVITVLQNLGLVRQS